MKSFNIKNPVFTLHCSQMFYVIFKMIYKKVIQQQKFFSNFPLYKGQDCCCKECLLFVALQCQRCAPLYNDKPFRSGDQLQPMNCRPCQCHGHALSCHYDILADDRPDEHYQGGGGVCDHCMHNTTGAL